jgi:hypothetical protein
VGDLFQGSPPAQKGRWDDLKFQRVIIIERLETFPVILRNLNWMPICYQLVANRLNWGYNFNIENKQAM